MYKSLFLTLILLVLGASTAFAQGAPTGAEAAAEVTAATTQTHLNYVWIVLAAMLVFFMQAGFALVETGFTRSKNAVNIIMKNVMDVSAGGLMFFILGFGLMFGTTLGGWIGTDGFFLTSTGDQETTWVYAFFLFQAVFAATAATIVSGAVAAATTQTHLNYVWIVLAAMLVFFMQAGFALVETGFTRSKNAVNIIMKNVMDVSAGGLMFFILGFGLMFGTTLGGWIGTDGFFLTSTGDQETTWVYAFFLFAGARQQSLSCTYPKGAQRSCINHSF